MNKKNIVSPTYIRKYGLVHCVITTAVCLLILSILSCSPGRDRIRRHPPEGKSADEIISMMTKRLGLNGKQVAQVRPIIEQECEKRRRIFENNSGQGREAMMSARAELQQVREASESKLSTILTTEQMKEYRKLLDEEEKVMRERRGGRGMRGF